MSGRRLYIGRTPPDVTRKDLEAHFGGIGPIVEIRTMTNFAFVEYEDIRDAETAVATLDGRELLGERLLVQFARPPRERQDRDRRDGPPRDFRDRDRDYGRRDPYDRREPPRERRPPRPVGYKLMISNLPSGTSWQDLKDFARIVGSVSFADIDRDDPSIGYVEFPSRADADEAIRVLPETDLRGERVIVEEDPRAPVAPRDYGRDDRRDYGRDDRRDYGRDDRRDYGRDDRRDYGRDDRRDYGRDDRRDYGRDDRRDYGRDDRRDYGRDDRRDYGRDDRRDDRRDYGQEREAPRDDRRDEMRDTRDETPQEPAAHESIPQEDITENPVESADAAEPTESTEPTEQPAEEAAPAAEEAEPEA